MKKASTKTQLAKEYGVNYITFLNWIKNIQDLNLNPKQRILTPKQVTIIYNHLGEP